MENLKIHNLNFYARIASNQEEVLAVVDKAIKANEPGYIVAVNPEKIVNTASKPEWKDIYANALVNYADGIGVKIAMKLLHGKSISRVTGVDLFFYMMQSLDQSHGKLFFFGSKPETLNQVLEVIAKKYAGLKVVGHHSGYGYDSECIVMEIEKTKPDLIVVALGSPKQEEWICTHGMRVSSGVFMGVGGSLDVFSGNVKRAPRFYRALGLEWLHRLLAQPSRWRRQVKLLFFAWKVFVAKCTKH